jgi:hypothetical protein
MGFNSFWRNYSSILFNLRPVAREKEYKNQKPDKLLVHSTSCKKKITKIIYRGGFMIVSQPKI